MAKDKKNKDKGFVAEFKKFIMRGNVMDMAVGVIVGGAFTAIVTSLNKDILTPLLALFGGIDFSYLQLVMGEGEEAPVLLYGNFITAVLNFLITAFMIFLLIKGINALGDLFSKKEEEAGTLSLETFEAADSFIKRIVEIGNGREIPKKTDERFA